MRERPAVSAHPDSTNPEMELSFLKGVLFDAPKAIATLRKLHPRVDEYFHDLRNEAIYTAVCRLLDAGKPVEPFGIHAALAAGANVDLPMISSLWAQAFTGELTEYYAEGLADLWRRRCLKDLYLRASDYVAAGDTEGLAIVQDEIAAVNRPAHSDLPEIEDSATLVSTPHEKPAELVYGLLHRGSKLVLGGSSKSFKTWSLLDLALAVSHGEPFWSMKVSKGRALYLNLEVQAPFFSDRIKAVAHGKNIDLEPGQLDVWNLRGHAADYRTLLPKIRKRVLERGYSLIILDPLYKLLGDADENSAGDMANLMNEVERLARDTGAAIAFGSHFAKGNASAKDSIDRISGSGVFARDPDSILTLTKHEMDECFAVEATLRNFKPLQPFVVQWQFPLMRRVDLDPAKLKQAGGRKAEHTTENIIPFIAEKPLPTAEWQRLSQDEAGVSRRTFYRLYKELRDTKKIEEKEGKWTQVP